MFIIKPFTFLLVLGLSGAAYADTLAIPGHYDNDSRMVMPRRGINMDQVLAEFGEPEVRKEAVGDPPITEWDYGDFRVYFEYQTVLHSVDLTTMIMPR
jgi:hypothetical protein